MDENDSIRTIFFAECAEQIEALEHGLQTLARGDGDAETVNTVFRSVHSIKGGAGIFGLTALVDFSHTFESTLDLLREQRLTATPATIAALFCAMDALSDLIHACEAGQTADSDAIQSATRKLREIAPDPAGDVLAESSEDALVLPFDFQPVPLDFDAFSPPDGGTASPQKTWTIRFAPRRGLYDRGNDPIYSLAALNELGDCTIILDQHELPPLEMLDVQDSYLTWTITLNTDAEEASIRDVFDWVFQDATIEITSLPLSDVPAVSIPSENRASPATQSDDQKNDKTNGALTESVQARTLPTEPASTESEPKAATLRPSSTIRVDLTRVDDLINLVGELVIGQASLRDKLQKIDNTGVSALMEATDTLGRLIRDLQDAVMLVRAQPIQSVFQRMERLLREAAAATGKEVRLIVRGADTEVDRTIVEQLAEPLTHMLRNSVDHGIEPPEQRVANGKTSYGTIELTARHRSGRVVIEVADDGAGINRSKVHRIAVNRGLIDAGTQLSDQDLDGLIFRPGFSTAETVSSLSGRGVGMDVVKKAITALGGRISVNSEPGQGSTFLLSLPLTLAVLEGMAVTVAGHVLIVPVTSIVETLRPHATQISCLMNQQALIFLRGVYIPIIDVACDLGFRSAPVSPLQAVVLIVESETGALVALVVDAIVNNMQVVIKSIERHYRKVPGISAATILGDGQVALILDIDSFHRSPSPEAVQCDGPAKASPPSGERPFS
ncbi:chemotaxis protein histidine kinase [Ameyamaea chiangmaiensis NBRC 103196]|uniref:Chemotaxis protein CheA n=1 Tax=Ameyamaea chiangmaiensis TaxID=442969 RepID=A0A850P667_9PROT|nr:chemotaxis protein CheA [Ameyamaea chiangmaiensis]MBS4076015.1 chemotaxis protein CheA [Ameyamaea chiangmaiensis]NVN40117.1 chemotaxis protein CheA [Ameyamaea chiangmaiensis]GBQ61453.1 chemotaxis protein histidine kinase [Ameyamaea chiangmaiensis NBRC 103196]